MKKIAIPNTDLETSKFIFGTASLFKAGRQRQRRYLLDAAVAEGFSHFDTAPLYGFGSAERDLATVLKSNPEVTFTTKVGLYGPGGGEQSDTSIFLRKAAGRLVKKLSLPKINFQVAEAQKSLESSLARCERECVDLYLLHEPEVSLVKSDEWMKWLDTCVRNGKVARFGMSLNAEKLRPFLESTGPIGGVIQLQESINGTEASVLTDYLLPKQITFGYVSAALMSGERIDVSNTLRAAILCNSEGAIVVSTTRPSRLKQYAEISLESFRA